MKILLVNPPNCGRSIPEEEYGITSLKLIFRGEPLALEVLAGNLDGHEVELLDLKAEPESIERLLAGPPADLVGFTAVTCEANTVLRLTAEMQRRLGESCPTIVVGGHHASCDPEYFNVQGVDYVVVGLGKSSFRQLVDCLERGDEATDLAGVARTSPGRSLVYRSRRYGLEDLAEQRAPRYDLVAHNRDSYVMSGVGGRVGFVVSAFGCTHRCSFCSIPAMTGGRYLCHSPESIIRDIRLLGDIPLIRFVDANTFGDRQQAADLARRLLDSGLQKSFVADVRADTVVGAPELMRLWKQAGLAAVVIGFEEIDDQRLAAMNKRSSRQLNVEALELLAEIGIRVIADFIVSPDYVEEDFARLAHFIEKQPIHLPIPSILTPIPGTELYRQRHKELVITDLDYFTFSNAVLPTRLPTKDFYTHYASLMRHLHRHITPKTS